MATPDDVLVAEHRELYVRWKSPTLKKAELLSAHTLNPLWGVNKQDGRQKA